MPRLTICDHEIRHFKKYQLNLCAFQKQTENHSFRIHICKRKVLGQCFDDIRVRLNALIPVTDAEIMVVFKCISLAYSSGVFEFVISH